jgi:hypothetical protein
MAKTFSGETTYSVTPDAAFERHIDEDFLRRKFEAQGARDIEVESTRSGDRVTLKIDRRAEAEIPGFAKRVVSPTNTIHLVEEWRPEGGGYVCDWHAEISPAPARLKGTRTLLPSGGGTADITEGTIEVKVPLIGGKLADWMSGEASKAVEDEIAWIAQQDG